MLTIKKYKKLLFAVILLSILSLTIVIQGAVEQPIDLNEITKSNPFLQLTSNQNRTPAGEMTLAVKPELIVETATLKFLDAKSVKTSISGMSSAYGSMEPDSKGNTLIICDTNENLEKILKQLRKIDRKPDQIMIEVVILDVKLNDDTEIGVDWDLLTTNDKTAAFRQNLDFTSRLKSSPRAGNIDTATAYNTIGNGSDLWLLWPGDIKNVIHTIQQKNNVEILASPRVMVVSGQTASIEAVEEVPYSETSDTSSGGSLTSTQFKNVGVMLKVGATLTDDKFILLNVQAEQNVQTGTSVVETVKGTPIIDTRKIQSSLLLSDGEILVIGGLRRKDTQRQTNQLPILGDLPIVGYAFKSTDTIKNSAELLVLLSPHINGGKPSEAHMEKFNEITQRPLLTIPETEERKKEEQKKEAEKKKAQEKQNMKKEKLAKKQSK
jgi:type II secretory pathway component GspD/PulD (secretin)